MAYFELINIANGGTGKTTTSEARTALEIPKNQITLLATSAEVSTLATGDTILWTPSASQTAMITTVATKVTTHTGSNVATQPIVALGTNSGGPTHYNNWNTGTTYSLATAVSSLGYYAILYANSPGKMPELTSSVPFGVNFTQASVGPTTHKFTFYIWGYLI